MDDRRNDERRQRLMAIRFPDRRRGFPRRTVDGSLRSRYLAVLGSIRDNAITLVLMAALLLALNVADLALTNRALAGGAVEVNPVMAALFESSPAAAASVKLGLSAVVVAGLWSLRRYRQAVAALLWTCVAMGLLVGYQTVLVTAII